MGFGEDFKWGVATAAFQIEGGYEDRGDTIWDMFCRKDGAVQFGHDGKVACDHYNRYKEDIKIMKEIGVDAYRFSISWSRLMPDGLGKINPKGVAFYDDLINELLKNKIRPYVTLFHWDYPLALYRKGGWLSPDSPKWFAEYVKVVMDLFSDRVSDWMTMNETLCFIGLGYGTGVHAPGLKLSEEEVLLAAHNALLAHGMAVQTIRSHAKTKPNIGYAPVGEVKIPSTPLKEDEAYREMFRVYDPHYWGNAMWVDPIFFGKYDDEILSAFEKGKIKIKTGDMKIISEPIDFLGVNIYLGGKEKQKIGFEQTTMGWEITPEALYWGPKFYYKRYKKPIYITENGMANTDVISSDGMVHDPQRIEFLRRYLSELKKCADEGTDIRGYFQWSLMDNFEWAEGYQKRFGLVYVDYETQKRILKDSAYWYKDVIRTNGRDL
ncbi:MAG: GH1 family beta-glucosidase [Clostridia bacterium]|nr:GH1 family beta-glucosidase [Clostridia bacterium]